MKKILLSLFAISSLFAFSQTAGNFNCNDCASANHDLFTELNSGKVIVIAWVMPCSNCINGATAGRSAVQSFSTSNPGQVLFYLSDDVANTNCATLQNWATTNNISYDAMFSNSAVSMSPYGATGMPKLIVIGGISTHSVYFNQNGSAANNMAGMQAAINQALADIAVTGIKEISSDNFQTKISPNPVSNELKLSYNSTENLTIDIFNLSGAKVKSIENTNIGKSETKINIEGLSNGTYFLKLNNGKKSDNIKFIVSH